MERFPTQVKNRFFGKASPYAFAQDALYQKDQQSGVRSTKFVGHRPQFWTLRPVSVHIYSTLFHLLRYIHFLTSGLSRRRRQTQTLTYFLTRTLLHR